MAEPIPEGVALVNVNIEFKGGPNDGARPTFSVPAEKGAPQRIEVIGVDPETKTSRTGVYRQSAFHPFLYTWQGWSEPAQPIKPRKLIVPTST